MLNEFDKQGNNPVIAHKFQGEVGTGILTDLDNKDFIFVIMHPGQKMMFKQFAMNTICVDSTHGTNRYGFILIITLLIIDDYYEVFP